MEHLGTLKDYEFADQAADLRGAELYGAKDEKLGSISDVIFEHHDGRIRYVVIDTGGWLKHKEFIVPAEMIHPYAKHEDHFAADLTKKQIESFPAYDEASVRSPEAWKNYEDQYRRHWESQGSVGHQIGSDRNVTPPPSEMPTAELSTGPLRTEAGSMPDLTPRRIVSPTKLPEGPTSTLHDDQETATSHAVEPIAQERKWEVFQNNVREGLPALRKRCTACESGDEGLSKAS